MILVHPIRAHLGFMKALDFQFFVFASLTNSYWIPAYPGNDEYWNDGLAGFRLGPMSHNPTLVKNC
uniref:Uncharacterized protein n=1 Tax=Candidatus Kentrum sp. LPFa TaxID=2126335 RepID=A0A450WBA4_9GAMM|nr:MAG: hypothetical protein BECKLPF1236B_GA0070989_10606 [Candidatus Kentron sp. LPFa]